MPFRKVILIRYRVLAISTSVFLMLIIAHPIFAQRYTYFGGGVNLHSAIKSNENSTFHLGTTELVDGGGYDVILRQEFNNFLSFESGISAYNYSKWFTIDEEISVWTGGFTTHRIPIKAEVEVDIFRDRIAAYASFGYTLCIRSEHDPTANSPHSVYADNIMVEWGYISDNNTHSQFNVGVGSRFRLVDQLILELELGFAFRPKNLVEYHFSYWDQTGQVQHFSFQEGMDYWYLQFGLSYPIQRILQGIKSGLGYLNF